MRDRAPRILLIVAPSLVECNRTAAAFDLDLMCLDRMRCVTSAYHLRGWSAGTPFVATNRQTWGRNPQAIELDQALDACIATGRLRIAGERDLEDLRIRSVA